MTTKNKIGTLDVLPLHENFISRIEETRVIRTIGAAYKEFQLQSGNLKVSSNAVEIFLGLESIN